MPQYQHQWSLTIALAMVALVSPALGEPSAYHSLSLDRRATPESVTCFSHVRRRVLARNNRLKKNAEILRSLKAQSRQVGLLPNPVIEVEAANFPTNPSNNGTEITAALAQKVELGGKRSARVERSNAQVKVLKLQTALAKANLMATAWGHYIDAITANSLLNLSSQEVSIRERALQVISRKSDFGAALPLEVQKARVAVESAKLMQSQRQQSLQSANQMLASLWGGNANEVAFAETELLVDRPELELTPFSAGESLDLAHVRAKHQEAERNLELERVQAVPDITAMAGVRRFDATNDHSVVIGLSVPLAIFDRNQFAVEGAERLTEASRFETAETEVKIRADAQKLQNRLEQQLREREVLMSRILPVTKRILTAATKAYQRGRVSYLDFLDAQTTYLERRERLISVTASALHDQVAIQRLRGSVSKRIKQMEGTCNE